MILITSFKTKADFFFTFVAVQCTPSDMYLEPSRTSKMEVFPKIIYVRLGSKYVSDHLTTTVEYQKWNLNNKRYNFFQEMLGRWYLRWLVHLIYLITSTQWNNRENFKKPLTLLLQTLKENQIYTALFSAYLFGFCSNNFRESHYI